MSEYISELEFAICKVGEHKGKYKIQTLTEYDSFVKTTGQLDIELESIAYVIPCVQRSLINRTEKRNLQAAKRRICIEMIFDDVRGQILREFRTNAHRERFISMHRNDIYELSKIDTCFYKTGLRSEKSYASQDKVCYEHFHPRLRAMRWIINWLSNYNHLSLERPEIEQAFTRYMNIAASFHETTKEENNLLATFHRKFPNMEWTTAYQQCDIVLIDKDGNKYDYSTAIDAEYFLLK